jgi:hypothetical protein
MTMISLVKAVNNHQTVLASPKPADQSKEAKRELNDSFFDIAMAAAHHVRDSHITLTHPDGSSGRKEVYWEPQEQRFIDWGNNFWLYGPNSFMGERAGGTWVLHARHEHEVIVAAILDRAKLASKAGDSPYLHQKMWRFYWQLLLMDVLRHTDDATVDLHLKPLNVCALAPKPEPRRVLDRILVD